MRQQTLTQLAEGASVEEAAPPCFDPDRVPDANTVRRWTRRRIDSLRFCAAVSWHLLCVPTLFVWDWRSALRILSPESNPP